MTAKTFIDRPILAGVISVLIVILGVIGLVQLPIEQFPDIAPPTVRVHPADVLSTLSGYVGGSYSSNLNRFTKLYRVIRFNLFPSMSVFGEQGEGYSSGEAIKAIKDVAGKYFPAGFGYEMVISQLESGLLAVCC